MIKLWEFFSSFDKLMKEKLVKAFYWLVLINISLHYLGVVFQSIGLDPLDDILDFFRFFTSFLMLIVGFRLAAELAIAIFRINDNLSPDGGKSETANIDPLDEARRAAEAAARRAREATKSTFEKTSEATRSTFDKASDATKQTFEKSHVEEPRANPARTPKVKATTRTRTATPKKATTTTKTRTNATAPKKTTAKKKTPTRKTTTRKTTSSAKYNKDGTIKRKPGPKPGSSSKYTKDGRLKKKPGPKKK